MRVCVVDDSLSARRALQSILEDRGHEVRSFEDVEGALSSLNSEPADLVFCDLILQDQDGVELWKRLRAREGLAVPDFILISGLVDDGVLRLARDEGIEHVLSKPFSASAIDDLLVTIRSDAELVPMPVETPDAQNQEATEIAAVSRELADVLLVDLSGVAGIEEVAVFYEDSMVARSAPAISEELRTWRTRATQLLRRVTGPDRSVVLESGGEVLAAFHLDSELTLVARLSRFSAIGPLRFFTRRRSVHRLDSEETAVERFSAGS